MQNESPKKAPKKAIALLSGGLDSTLAAKIVKDQGVEVVGLHLLSPFGCKEDVEKTARNIGISLIVKEKGESYLDLVENPRYGYGKNMNPCIDCRIFMFQLADVVRQDQGADFIVTGEVLGQRPMSQQRHSMEIIDRQSPMEGLILRPLSAHCFPPTIPEEKGWVNREALFQISGRGRKDQIELAKKFGIEEYSAPGGGCLLTEAGFSSRLKDFFGHKEYAGSEDRLAQAQMLRLGRHFRKSDDLKIIIGRNQKENEELKKLWKAAQGSFFVPSNFDGPVAVTFGEPTDEARQLVGEIIARYGKSSGLEEMKIDFETSAGCGTYSVTRRVGEDVLETMRL